METYTYHLSRQYVVPAVNQNFKQSATYPDIQYLYRAHKYFFHPELKHTWKNNSVFQLKFMWGRAQVTRRGVLGDEFWSPLGWFGVMDHSAEPKQALYGKRKPPYSKDGPDTKPMELNKQ